MTCPDLETLEAIALGRDAPPDAARHAATCAACAAQLEDVRANLEIARDLTAATTPFAGADADADPRPDLLSRGYRVLRELHRGGQGVVHLCEHEPTRRRVAVKTLLAGPLASARARRRFEREGELIAQLRHPNVVTVFDSGVSDDGRAFIAMEYVEGCTLRVKPRARLTQGELRSTLAQFLDICAGVSAAHRRGVIHRDLKPGNILIDLEGVPRVLDFGIAKSLERTDAERTREHEFVGTIAYAAPEQIASGPGAVDARTDIYALGLVLAEMLTGTHARPRDTPLAGLLELVISGHVEPPSAHMRDLDDDLDAIVLKAAHPDPDARYATVESLRDDVQRFLDGRPIEAKRGRRWYVARKTLVRHRAPIALATLFVTALVALTLVSLTQARAARLEANKANAIRVFLEDTLASVDPESPDATPTIAIALDEAVHWIEIALSDQPEVAASLRGTIGNSYRAIGRYHDAEAQITLALNARREMHGDVHPEVAESINQLGLLRRDQGRFDDAEALMREALSIRRDAFGPRHPRVALSLMNLGTVALRDDRPADARALFEQALAIQSRLHADANPDVAMCVFRLGEAAEALAEPAEALSHYRRALAIRRGTLHRLHPDLARALLATGRIGLQLDEPDAATLLEEGVGLLTERLTDSHQRVGGARLLLARALADGGRVEDARTHAAGAAATLMRTRGANDPLTRDAERLLAELSR